MARVEVLFPGDGRAKYLTVRALGGNVGIYNGENLLASGDAMKLAEAMLEPAAHALGGQSKPARALAAIRRA